MQSDDIKKSLLAALAPFITDDDKANRDNLTELIAVLRSSEFRRLYTKIPTNYRNSIHNSLYPYEECRVAVKCPHCGARVDVDATTTSSSTANGFWAVVVTEGRLYLDWNDDYEVEVNDLEYLCPKCAQQIAGSLDELEALWRDQQKQTISEELGILGK